MDWLYLKGRLFIEVNHEKKDLMEERKRTKKIWYANRFDDAAKFQRP